MDQHLATPPTQVSSTRPRAGNNTQSINPDPVQLRRSSRRLQSSSGTWRHCSVIVNSPVGNVTEPSLVRSYFRVIRLFTFLSFVIFHFFRTRSSSFLPRCSPSSSRFHGSSSPHPQSSLNAWQIHGHSPPRSPSFHGHRPSSWHFVLSGETTPQLVSSGSHGSKSRSRDLETLDRAHSVRSIVPVIIKCLRAKSRSLCRLGHFGSVLRSIKFFARFLEYTTLCLICVFWIHSSLVFPMLMVDKGILHACYLFYFSTLVKQEGWNETISFF